MHTIIYKLKDDTVRGWVSESKAAVYDKLEFIEGFPVLVAWRYHDGSGWADGSIDAHVHIGNIGEYSVRIV